MGKNISAYQLEQNKKLKFNFRQDLQVIEKMIEQQHRIETMQGLFENIFHISPEIFPQEWKHLEFNVPMAKKAKPLEKYDIEVGPLRLLLLLGYIMTTAVGEDESVTSQM